MKPVLNPEWVKLGPKSNVRFLSDGAVPIKRGPPPGKTIILDPTAWRKDKRYVACMKRLAKLVKKETAPEARPGRLPQASRTGTESD
jgi:hypothetical protein